MDSSYQISIILTSILGILGAIWMTLNLKFPKTAFSSLMISLAISDMATSVYAMYSMISAPSKLTTDSVFNYLFLDTGFYIALAIALLALKIVKYGYSIESFVWIKIMTMCLVPSMAFLIADALHVPRPLLQLLHCSTLTFGFMILLLAYISTMVELESQKRIRKIAYEKGNVASRLMMRLLMCFGILHILFYLPHLALLWTEYVHVNHLKFKLVNAFYIYEWIAMSSKGFFHALAICFVLLLKPSKVPMMVKKTSVDTMSSDTVVLPPKIFERIERYTKNPRQPKFVAALPPVSPTTSDTIIDHTIDF